MAGLKRCIGVDIGGHSVKIVEMAADKKGLRIERMVTARIDAEPNASEEDRYEAVAAAVRGLVKTHKITTKQAIFSMPGQTVIVRPLRLPRAPGPRLHQIINFEARQIVPFPLEQTMLQYQVFDTEEEREVEVLLVAMKKETNKEFMRLVKRTGLKPAGIGISTLALFNGQELHRLNISDGLVGDAIPKPKKKKPPKPQKVKKPKKKKKKGKKDAEEIETPEIDETPAVEDDLSGLDEEFDGDDDLLDLDLDAGFEEVRAYINLGARATDLAVCKAGGSKAVGFVRPIPIGGNHVSAAIFKECGCSTFQEAEKIKMEQTAILSGQFEFEGDKEAFNEKSNIVATTVCDRIIAELRRSLDYFISQPDGVAVDLIILSGGGARLPFLAGYIEERLGIPVEIDSGLGQDQIRLPKECDEEFDYAPYKIAIGLATQGLEISPLDINFLSAEILAMRGSGALMGEVAILAAMIAGMAFFGSQVGEKTRRQTQDAINARQEQIEQLKPDYDRYTAARTGKLSMTTAFQTLAPPLAQPRDFWLRVLDKARELKPPEALFTNFTTYPTSAQLSYRTFKPVFDYSTPVQGQIIITCQAENKTTINTFGKNIENEIKKGKSLFVAFKTMHGLNPTISYVPKLLKSDHFDSGQAYICNFVLTVQEEGNRPVTNLLDAAAKKKADSVDPATSGVYNPYSGGRPS